MARRTLFTVLLSVTLVLSSAPQPEAHEGASPASATAKSFSVKTDGPRSVGFRAR